MQMRYTLVVLFVTMVGCGQQGPVIPNQAPLQPAPAVNQVEGAKAHVQQYIDRLMGGDQSVKGGLLGLAGVDFNSIESIEIRSAVPAFSPDGKKIENMVKVQINIRGYDALKRRNIEQNISQEVFLKDGKWKFLGSSL
jgi:hypothetical protein